MNEGTQAWILHKQWSGETSAKVVFFTEHGGVIHSTVQGGRSPKKQATLQSFTPLWVMFRERKGWYYVQSLEMSSATLPLTDDHLKMAWYVNELVYCALRPQDTANRVYQAYEITLRALATSMEPWESQALLRRFEWTLLCFMGYAPSLSLEARSGSMVNEDCYYRLIPGEGFVRAEEGILGAHLHALSKDELHDALVLKSAKRIMRLALHHALGGRELHSRKLFS